MSSYNANMTKDYYRILGVLDDAEDVVIRAAYKALAQRYHPDKWTGDKEEANRRMQEINEAYGVLSDAIKRKQYDETRDRSEYQDESDFESYYQDTFNKDIEDKWKKIVDFLPDLEQIYDDLSRTSRQLAYSYKILLIENKNFNDRFEIAKAIENNFLQIYFGTNKKIIQFAKELIRKNRRDMARELNIAVNLLGSNIEPNVIIKRIIDKFPSQKTYDDSDSYVDEKTKLAQIFLRNKSLNNALKLFKIAEITVVPFGWFTSIYHIEQYGTKTKVNELELLDHAEKLAKKILS
jgi:curved DNA-binding protein CbpA